MWLRNSSCVKFEGLIIPGKLNYYFGLLLCGENYCNSLWIHIYCAVMNGLWRNTQIQEIPLNSKLFWYLGSFFCLFIVVPLALTYFSTLFDFTVFLVFVNWSYISPTQCLQSFCNDFLMFQLKKQISSLSILFWTL